MCCAMYLGIDLIEPFLASSIDIWERLEGSAGPEVVSQILDGVLYLAFCLSVIWIAEPDCYPIIFGEDHEFTIEPGL